MRLDHALAERRSLALHRAIAGKIESDASIVPRARERLSRALCEKTTHPKNVEAWRELLALTPKELARKLVEDSERMRELRQSTPMSFVIGPRERWRIWRDVREAG